MPISMNDLNSAFKGTFLKAADLTGPTVLTIKDTAMEQVGEDGLKPVVEFTSGQKLVLNKTNRSAISIACGSEDPAVWNGKAITLASKQVEFRGEYVPAVRVDPNAPDAAAAAAAPADDVPY